MGIKISRAQKIRGGGGGVSIAGVVIFSGLTAYDTQWIKRQALAASSSADSDMAHRIALIGAFRLFLDFVNLFLSLLRIFGRGN